MKILTNEYRTNLPGESDAAHGGPANFAHAFSAYAVKHGHFWGGLIQRGHDAKTTSISRAAAVGKKTWFDCYLPQSRYKPFLQIQKKRDPRVWFAEEIAAIRAHIRSVAPDVLFLNGFSVYAWLLLEAASQEGLPIVVQHAGIAQVEFEQYKHLYSRAGRKAMLDMERDIVKAACKQIFLNEYSRAAFSRLVARVPAGQAMVIPLPYATDFARKAGIKDGKAAKDAGRKDVIYIGAVARWDRIKNHRALLRLAQEAKKRGLPWKFKTVTRIPDTKIEARFKSSYRREIEVVAPMDRSKLPAFYRSVDVLLLPSHFDVSPTVVMEAALLGKRTLISQGVGWNSEYRAAGLKEWIADFSDAPKTVRALQRLLATRPTDRFRNMIRTKHAPDKVFAAYLRAFSVARRLCA